MPKQRRQKSHKDDFQSTQYLSILEMANDGFLIFDSDGIIFSNPAISRITGFEFDELQGIELVELIEHESLNLFKEKQLNIEEDNSGAGSFSSRIKCKEGHIIDVDIGLSHISLEGNSMVLAVIRDMTKRKELEAAYETSQKRLEDVYQSAPIAFFTLSKYGMIQNVNPAAETLLGFELNDLVRRNITSLMSAAEHSSSFANELLEQVLQGKRIHDVETKMRHADGSNIWVSLSASLITESPGKELVNLMVTNIHRRKTAEEKEKEERERANLYLEVMTHDLTNINQGLSFSIGLIEAAMELPPRVQELVRDTNWYLRRSARMIANLRSLIELDEVPSTTERTNISEIISLAMDSVQRDFPWKEIEVNIEFDNLSIDVLGHSLLSHAVFNILHNASMHNESNEIQVDVRITDIDGGERVRIDFSDYGPGVQDSLKEFIFKRTGSPDAQVVGRGLGLTVADAIVKKLGGNIWVEDRVKGNHGKGSNFVLVLPVWTESKELECGREACISFYRSNHCLFCNPVKEMLDVILDEMGIPSSIVRVVNVDDPRNDISQSAIPVVPMIRACGFELTGFVGENEIRKIILETAAKPCFMY